MSQCQISSKLDFHDFLSSLSFSKKALPVTFLNSCPTIPYSKESVRMLKLRYYKAFIEEFLWLIRIT